MNKPHFACVREPAFYAVFCLLLIIRSGCESGEVEESSSTKAAGDTTVLFRLDVDPSVVDSVQLDGEFNGWESGPIPMIRDTAGHRWAVSVPLSLGQTSYKYRFRVHRSDSDTWLTVTDPRSRLVDASLDRNSVVILQEQSTPFSPFTPPRLHDLIIYELNPREFVDPQVPFADASAEPRAVTYGEVFQTITETIEDGYFTGLGVNAIELMPVTATAWTNLNRDIYERDPWGYACISWFGLNGDFGTPEDLKILVESAHQKGIAVLLDFSMGHGSGQIMAKIHPDWLKDSDNPWGMIEFDMSVEGARNYMLEAAKQWLQEYNMDGFRMDWVDQYKDEATEWYPGGTWAWFTQQLRELKPDIILIAENPTAEIVRHTQFDSCWDFFFADWCSATLLREVYTYYDGFGRAMVSSQMKLAENLTEYVDAPWGPHKPPVRFIESHDSPRIARQTVVAQHGGGKQGMLDMNGDGIVPDTLRHGSVEKSQLGAVLLFTVPGPVMLFQGQEFGLDDELNWEYDPLDWSLRTVNGLLFQFYKNLISLRKSRESLRSEDLTLIKNDTTNHLFVYARGMQQGDPTDDDVVVALNFGRGREGIAAVPVPFTRPGVWVEFLSGDTLKVGTNLLKSVDFEYSEGKIFLHQAATSDHK